MHSYILITTVTASLLIGLSNSYRYHQHMDPVVIQSGISSYDSSEIATEEDVNVEEVMERHRQDANIPPPRPRVTDVDRLGSGNTAEDVSGNGVAWNVEHGGHHRKSVDQSPCASVTMFSQLTVDCSSSGIESISNINDVILRVVYTRVRVLRLDDNWLKELNASMLGNILPQLEHLILTRNIISRVDDEAFRGLDRLRELDVSDNRLMLLPVGSFRHLAAIRRITFRGNSIGTIGPNSFSSLKLLETIDLSFCGLRHIDARSFVGCRRLVAINLADNQLTQLDPQMASNLPPRIWNYTKHGFGTDTMRVLFESGGYGSHNALHLHHTGLRLDGNPWRCDCHLRWIRRLFRRSAFRSQGDIEWPTCDSPTLIHSVAWQNLVPEQFACPSHIVADDSDEQDGGEEQEPERRNIVIEVNRGGNATLRCVVTGDPKPRVEWTRVAQQQSNYVSNRELMAVEGVQLVSHFATSTSPLYDKNIENETLYSGTKRRFVSVLHLTTATASRPDGVYLCKAINSAGRDEIAYTVSVVDNNDVINSSGHQMTVTRTLPTRAHSRRRQFISWTTMGRSIAVFGMTLIVVIAALVALIVVRRNRLDVRRRIRDASGTKYSAARRSKRYAAQLGRSLDRNELLDVAVHGRHCHHTDDDIHRGSPMDVPSKVSVGSDRLQPRDTHHVHPTPGSNKFKNVTSRNVRGVTRSDELNVGVSRESRFTGRTFNPGGIIAAAAWELQLSPIQESFSETNEFGFIVSAASLAMS